MILGHVLVALAGAGLAAAFFRLMQALALRNQNARVAAAMLGKTHWHFEIVTRDYINYARIAKLGGRCVIARTSADQDDLVDLPWRDAETGETVAHSGEYIMAYRAWRGRVLFAPWWRRPWVQ